MPPAAINNNTAIAVQTVAVFIRLAISSCVKASFTFASVPALTTSNPNEKNSNGLRSMFFIIKFANVFTTGNMNLSF